MRNNARLLDEIQNLEEEVKRILNKIVNDGTNYRLIDIKVHPTIKDNYLIEIDLGFLRRPIVDDGLTIARDLNLYLSYLILSNIATNKLRK